MELAAQLGSLLPEASAKALEKILPLNPSDLISRARLLGHYWKHYDPINHIQDAPDATLATKRTNHILWFIENAPDCIFAGDYYLSCDASKDTSNYRKISDAWAKQVNARPKCTQSRINFAFFLLDHDSKLAADLLLQVRQIQPCNEWALSLLALLGHTVDIQLPLPVDVTEVPREDGYVQDRVSSVEWMLTRWSSFRSRILRATVETQERILEKDHYDIWARLDILRWCQRNLERANRLGFDPVVAQRWYRHALWMLRNVPHVNLDKYRNQQIVFSTKLPSGFSGPIIEAFIDAFAKSPQRAQVFSNMIGFFRANVGAEETKKLITRLQGWKELDRKTRQMLLKELDWKYEVKTIFEKNIDLDPISTFIDCELQPPVHLGELSMWANNLDLASATYEGYSYLPDFASNLEKALDSFENDLISTARLARYYSQHHDLLTSEQTVRFTKIMQWLIENIPESDYVAQVCWCEGESRVDVDQLKRIWQKHMDRSPKNSLVALNAANWLSQNDTTSALEIAQGVLDSEAENILAAAVVHTLSYDIRDIPKQLGFADKAFEDHCDKRIRSFHASANERLTAICDETDLYLYSLLDCIYLPAETLWSNEQALKMNPNDPILRCEIIGWCDRNHNQRVPLLMCDPELARRKTHHILWLLENVPRADLYFFTRYHHTDGLPSHEKIIKKAVMKQRKVYGKTVAKYRPQYPRKKRQSGQEA